MKRPLRPEEARLWAVVAATVRPRPGRSTPKPAAEPRTALKHASAPTPLHAAPDAKLLLRPIEPRQVPVELKGIEPNRRHRIARGRDPIAARLDLHGLDQDHARQRLIDFLLKAQSDGARAVLVITGKGLAGDGVLRRRAPEWLADPRLREVVAGLSHAETHHGGEGALYVALKRRVR